jgi:hypothetical protein
MPEALLHIVETNATPHHAEHEVQEGLPNYEWAFVLFVSFVV